MEVYELMPKNGRKSFYRKAYVRMYADGSQVMESYRTDILSRDEVALTDEQAEMSDLLCDEYGCDRDEANTIVSAYGGWVGEILSI